jgi:hypothetical protein
LPRAWSVRDIDLVEAMASKLSDEADQLMAAYRR